MLTRAPSEQPYANHGSTAMMATSCAPAEGATTPPKSVWVSEGGAGHLAPQPSIGGRGLHYRPGLPSCARKHTRAHMRMRTQAHARALMRARAHTRALCRR